MNREDKKIATEGRIRCCRPRESGKKGEQIYKLSEEERAEIMLNNRGLKIARECRIQLYILRAEAELPLFQ